MWGLKDRAAYFYTPADIAAGKAAPGQGDAARRDGREGLAQARGPTA
jgi:cytochrome c-type biogenesis protein CcmE